MARYLVTGGAGFIGSHLTDRLLASGHSVVVLDNFDDLYDPRIKRRNVEAHREHSGYRLIEGDIRSKGDLRAAFDGGIDKVVHLAAMAGVRRSLEEPLLYTDVNLGGTINVLESAVRAGTSDVVFSSSSSVYGANKKVPFHEEDPVDHPVSPYAATKKAAELLAHTYSHLHGMNVACLRLFTVYGPRQRPEMAIHRFARLIEAGEPIPVFGDGSSRRDYTYVDDIVTGILRASERSTGYRVFNLGGSKTVGLSELIGHLEAAIGRPARIKRMPDQPGDVPITYADLTRSRHELEFEPATTIVEGLRIFVEWMRAGPA